eukprot:TRINITY_DN10396_c0_g1_i1.p2 TRINITY_DN10396_c0_g1~~TRINITY_DN10396_c0_g1_i1.p2  ORF type:complete len:116 (-),score=33.10 TRINITY_DN10396_c0_g1_i1:163-510(-)
MIRRPPRSTQSRSSAASDVYKRQVSKCCRHAGVMVLLLLFPIVVNIVVFLLLLVRGTCSSTMIIFGFIQRVERSKIVNIVLGCEGDGLFPICEFLKLVLRNTLLPINVVLHGVAS